MVAISPTDFIISIITAFCDSFWCCPLVFFPGFVYLDHCQFSGPAKSKPVFKANTPSGGKKRPGKNHRAWESWSELETRAFFDGLFEVWFRNPIIKQFAISWMVFDLQILTWYQFLIITIIREISRFINYSNKRNFFPLFSHNFKEMWIRGQVLFAFR